jgi:hypothetical protein
MPRVSCFGNKDGGARVQGDLSPAGSAAFERARSRVSAYLRRVTGRAWSVSDGDTIEFLARGEVAAQKAIEKARK